MSISVLLFLIIDLVIFYTVCKQFFCKRTTNKKFKYVFIILLFLINVVVVTFISNMLFKYIVLTILVCLMMNILFDDNILTISLVVILIYGLFIIMDYSLVIFIEMYTDLQYFMKNPKNIFVAYSISRLLSVLVIGIFSLKKNEIILESRYLYKFILMSFLTIAGLTALIIPNENNFISNKYLIPFILIFDNLFVYYILNDFIKISDNLKIKSIGEERAKNELKLWQRLKEQDVVQRKIMHDYSNTIICIKGLLEQNNYNELIHYVESISVEYKLSKSFITTGNKLLDVLINTKYERALKNNITMILKLDDLTNLKIQSQDLVVLLSNLLDNAIEYTSKLPEYKREIFFSIHKENNLKIMVRNPIESDIIVVDNLIKTTKKGGNHGVGLVNVKEIIEKYKAEHYIDVDEEYFTNYIEI